MNPSTTAILQALAELAPAAPDRVFDVTRGGQPLAWLRDPQRCGRRGDVDRLAAVDLLHRDERILRRAWGLVVGTVETDGVSRRVRLPLLSEPVRLERTVRGYRVVPAGDLELTVLVEDRALAARLEAAPGLGGAGWLSATGTAAWLRTVAEAAGLAVDEVRTVEHSWPPRPPAQGLHLVVAAALYTVRDVFGVALRDSLRAWASRPGLDSTALAAVYGAGPLDPPRGTGVEDDEVLSPLPLTDAQVEVVRRARVERVAVLSGPPGNGKSHAVVAAAIDVVDRGGSVLVATQSPHAADVLGELLARYPGPTPVLFGDAERRAAIATSLAQGADAGVDGAVLRADRVAVEAAAARVRQLSAEVGRALDIEVRAGSLERWEPLIGGLSYDAPAAFEPGTDLAAAARDAGRAAGPAAGWWRRWRREAAVRRVRRRLGAAKAVPLDRLRDAIEAGLARQAAARLAATGGTDLTGTWRALFAAEADRSAALGTAMRHRARSASRWDREGRRSAAALATALRAGRNRRRELLAALDGPALVRAMPLWIGTVGDVEDLLPPITGLFDLVIVDEASHTDQIRAAPVLARARRALVVGDPRQLRFVSFVADVDVAATLSRHGLDDRVDVRRVSTFDLAAGAAPVTWLDEHFRSAPHLIGFSAARFYAGRIAVATRHPSTDAVDLIDVCRVPVGAVDGGVHRAEVDAAVAAVRQLADEGHTGIGVVTPFRSQADAIESALVAAFPVAEMERLGLRVGTVHSFQGSEAEVVVASLAVADADPAGRLRFLADPNLFNVMVSRARRKMMVLTSLVAPNGVIGDYLSYAAAPPAPYDGAPEAAGHWPRTLAAQLREVGVPVRCRYPVGRWTVDICAGEEMRAVGLICVVHPDGVTAHIARQRALTRAGWRLVEAYASRWNGDPIRAALDIAEQVRPA